MAAPDVEEVTKKLEETTVEEGTTKNENGEENGDSTIFTDPNNFTIKHPLQSQWTLWYDNPGKKATQTNWSDSLKEVYTFGYVEDFWALYNAIKPSSKLGMGSNYHLFKQGLMPQWEDPGNKNGGKWVATLPRSKRDKLDETWLYAVLAVIGENFPDSDEICGAVCSIRKANDRIALWTRNSEKEQETKAIGRQFKEMLNFGPKAVLGYQVHNDCIKRNRSFSNQNRYEV